MLRLEWYRTIETVCIFRFNLIVKSTTKTKERKIAKCKKHAIVYIAKKSHSLRFNVIVHLQPIHLKSLLLNNIFHLLIGFSNVQVIRSLLQAVKYHLSKERVNGKQCTNNDFSAFIWQIILFRFGNCNTEKKII